ncbi:uncharacterized protein UHOD_11138 [Ustilago sp. UG-2017b]|nr:uncharacterized protein UHOD_11138 [Ustilago sp. UG-2017b]
MASSWRLCTSSSEKEGNSRLEYQQDGHINWQSSDAVLDTVDVTTRACKALEAVLEVHVRGLVPETQVGLLGYSATIKLRDGSGWRLWYVLSQVSADLCGHSVQRWLGTISIDTTVMMTPRSGVSVDDDEIDSVGGKVGGVNTSVQCVDYRLR